MRECSSIPDHGSVLAIAGDVGPAGGELVGEVERYGNIYRLCYVRGPEGIRVELAERIG